MEEWRGWKMYDAVTRGGREEGGGGGVVPGWVVSPSVCLSVDESIRLFVSFDHCEVFPIQFRVVFDENVAAVFKGLLTWQPHPNCACCSFLDPLVLLGIRSR